MDSTQSSNHILIHEEEANENDDSNLNVVESLAEVKKGDALLVELVAVYSILYDKNLKSYKNVVIRDNCWAAIGSIMNMQRKSGSIIF